MKVGRKLCLLLYTLAHSPLFRAVVLAASFGFRVGAGRQRCSYPHLRLSFLLFSLSLYALPPSALRTRSRFAPSARRLFAYLFFSLLFVDARPERKIVCVRSSRVRACV